MEKLENFDAAANGEQSQSTFVVFSQETIRDFWKPTHEETDIIVSRVVEKHAKTDADAVLPTRVYKKLSKQERRYLQGASESELNSILQTHLDAAHRGQHNSQTSMQTGARVERSMTRFLDQFHGYVQAYSGVIHLMNGAGANYGDAAYGALSLFLVVAVNKRQTEQQIESMLATLQQQYCRIQLTKGIYGTPRMKVFIATVYRLGIEFLYEAIRYYSLSTLRKMWHVATQPPSMRLEEMVTEITTAIEEMTKEKDMLNGIRLYNVEQRVENLVESVQTLERSVDQVKGVVQGLQRRNDNDDIESIKLALNLEDDQLFTSLKEYERLLHETFEPHHRYPEFDVEGSLFCNSSFRQWRDCKPSSLLVIHGETIMPPGTDLSWLSIAAVRLINDREELFPTERGISVHYFCQTGDGLEARPKKVSPVVILSSFIVQILQSEKGKDFLRDEDCHKFLRRSIDALKSPVAKGAIEKVQKLYSILNALLLHLNPEHLMVMIDRFDRLAGDKDVFLDPLRDIMRRLKCGVKIFLTIRHDCRIEHDEIRGSLEREQYIELSFDQGY